MLHEEFALVLGIPRDQVVPYILKQLQGEQKKLWITISHALVPRD